jgi:hypothetical protein
MHQQYLIMRRSRSTQHKYITCAVKALGLAMEQACCPCLMAFLQWRPLRYPLQATATRARRPRRPSR